MPAQWLESAAAGDPSAPALHTRDELLDYAALAGRVDALCARLAACGIAPRPGPRPPVLAVVERDVGRLTPLLHATARIGWALQPLAPDLPPATAADLLRQSGACRLVAPHPLAGMPPVDPDALWRGSGPEGPAPAAPLAPGAAHLVMTTSGTQGGPKGVMLTGGNLAAAAAAARETGLGPGDRWLACLPGFHIGGLAIPYRCAAVGAAVVAHDRFDAARVWSQLWGHGITHLSLVPAMLHRLLDAAAEAAPPPSLREVLVGGGPLAPALAGRADAAGWPLRVSYGMTETCAQVVRGGGAAAGAGAVGRPVAGMAVELAAGGRIRIRGPQVMAGYANPEQLPGRGLAADGAFEPGDLGAVGDDGTLYILGRADEVLVSGGVNVHPQELEAELAECPGVTDAGVAGREDPVWGQVVVAVVAGAATVGEVDAWCRHHMAGARRPREFIKAQAVPRNATGKIDRPVLARLVGRANPD